MTFDRRSNSAAGNSDTTNDVSRRRLLQTTATGVVAATGLSVASGSVAADTDEIMEVDFRNGVPPISDAPQGEDEVVFAIHGYSSSSDSVDRAETFQQTARTVDYSETVTAVTWDDSGFPWTAERSARDTGDRFASWLEDYTNANPDTTIRILGHSMGGIVQMETLAAIDGSFTVDTADSIGSYEESDAPCQCGDFYDAIRDSAEEVHNYYSTNDWIAKLGDGPADCSGWFCDDTLPDNYDDVDVSDSVSGHSSYKSSVGCVSKIVENY